MDVRHSFEQWSDYYRQVAASGLELLWPSETLVRLFKGDYVPGLDHDFRGERLLDVGTGNGNNAPFLATLGLRLDGTEVTDRLAGETHDRLAKLGVAMHVSVGTNRALPYPDGTFDHLTSWNVIHYEQDDRSIAEAIREYARVLKPGGRCYVSTTGPEHRVLVGARPDGPRRYRIEAPDDFRRGQIMYCFETEAAARAAFSRYFAEVHLGRTIDRLLTHTLDWLIVVAMKR